MIIQHSADKQNILFSPEDMKERKIMDAFPGMLRHGLSFYCPSKPHLLYNLYTRLARKIKRIKFTPEIKAVIEGDIEIKELPEWFTFHTAPLKHQRIALRFAYTFGSFLNLSEPGLGKTKVTLDYIWLMQFKKSLIVCPKALRFVWEEERATHRPELSVYVVETTDWEKEVEQIQAASVVVINYDKAVSLKERLEGLQFDFIAVDEGLIKDPKTERTKALTELRRGIPHRCVMSGTLVNNSPLDVFSPLRFCEPALVGESYSKFRDTYAVMKKMRDSEVRILLGFKNLPEIKEILACCGVIMTKAEWLKHLPPKKFIHKYVQMSDKQRDYYHTLANNYLLQLPELGTEIEVDNPLTVLCKLNQISNGFIYYQEDVDETLGELYGTEAKKKRKAPRKTLFFEEQPKAKALLNLIRSEEFNPPGEDLKDRRAIIWFNLEAELKIIEECLNNNGISFLTIAGGTKNVGEIVRRFNRDPSVQFLLCQAKTINYGVTIMGTKDDDLEDGVVPQFDPRVSDEIFYSLNFSLEVFLQQQDRIHRIGQTRECRYWLLLTNSKIERTIADRLEEKLVCNREILVDISSSLSKEFA